MEREQIAAVLERYWQGETTLEEEKELRQYFSSASIPEELVQEAAYFEYLDAQQEKEAPSDKEILALIANVEPEPSGRGKQVSLWFSNIGKVAAVIFIVAVAAFFVHEDYESRREQMEPVIADTFEDPQKAFEETKKALMLVSQQFNKGKKQAQKLGVFDEATEKIQQPEREL